MRLPNKLSRPATFGLCTLAYSYAGQVLENHYDNQSPQQRSHREVKAYAVDEFEVFQAFLRTTADFGCNQWEGKDGDDVTS